ncbi:MAG TPA: Crp/Fnr family transcriptional regulator [Thermoanaerobaculia bacterium]
MKRKHGFDQISSCPNCRVNAADLFDRGMSNRGAEQLAAVTESRTCAEGDVLFEEGVAPSGLFIIDSGRVKLSRRTDVRTRIVKIARRGSVLGLGATLTQRPHQVTGETIEAATVRFIPFREFHRFLKRHPLALGHIVIYLEEHAHQDHPLSAMSPAAQKVAAFLIDSAYRDGRQTDEGISIDLPITLQELAFLLRMRRERLENALDKFEDRRWVYRANRTITLLDESTLAMIGGGRFN